MPHRYDIWGKVYSPRRGGFGRNERVQDDIGEFAKQRHAAVAGHAADGTLVVAWDDEREGGRDVMLSWREEEKWSEDWPLPNTSGAGHQSHPSIALDHDGNLHVAWVEREEVGGATRLR